MALGAVLVVALEHRVGPVARQDACQDILPAVIDGGIRGDRGLDAEQLEVREWRSLGLLVGDDADPFGVIDCNQPHLIDIGRLAQFLGQAHVEVTVAHLQLVPPDRHVLVVIDREVNTSCQASPERRNAQHLADVFEFATVPGVDHRTGAGQPRGFLDLDLGCRFVGHLVLDQPVRPSHANRVEVFRRAKPEMQRHAAIDVLGEAQAGLHLDT